MTDIRDAFFEEVLRLAQHDKNVFFITADMGAQSLDKFKAEAPSQYMNVGIAESNMLATAAGMALCGMKLFVYAIASFIVYRAYEFVKLDISGMNLPVTMIGAGPGLTYKSDGATHHSIHDVTLMRTMPNVVILTPKNSEESTMAAQMAYQETRPVYVRLYNPDAPEKYGKWIDSYRHIPFKVCGDEKMG